jgi:hypothetical protein
MTLGVSQTNGTDGTDGTTALKGGRDREGGKDVVAFAKHKGIACDCGRRHRTWNALAQCHWPKAEWISGHLPAAGPCFALLAHCNVC